MPPDNRPVTTAPAGPEGSAATFTVLPAIDLVGGRVVRLRQGDFGQGTTYDVTPAGTADQFAAAGARWLHVVDLDGARAGSPRQGPVIAAIVAATAGRALVDVAGGLRSAKAVGLALSGGAGRVVLGTVSLVDPAFVGRLVEVHGPAAVAVAVDVRQGRAVGDGWREGARDGDPADLIRRLAAVGVETFEVTAIDRDGLLGGPDLGLYERLAGLGLGTIVASGGITTVDDLRAVRDVGCGGAIVGRTLYEGRLDLAAAIALEREPEAG